MSPNRAGRLSGYNFIGYYIPYCYHHLHIISPPLLLLIPPGGRGVDTDVLHVLVRGLDLITSPNDRFLAANGLDLTIILNLQVLPAFHLQPRVDELSIGRTWVFELQVGRVASHLLKNYTSLLLCPRPHPFHVRTCTPFLASSFSPLSF